MICPMLYAIAMGQIISTMRKPEIRVETAVENIPETKNMTDDICAFDDYWLLYVETISYRNDKIAAT